jgi:hypothetical protein
MPYCHTFGNHLGGQIVLGVAVAGEGHSPMLKSKLQANSNSIAPPNKLHRRMVRYCFDIDLVADTCPAVEEGILAEDNPAVEEDILGVDSLVVGTERIVEEELPREVPGCSNSFSSVLKHQIH